MKSVKHGKNISPIEINITQFGMWLYVEDTEFYLSYEDYPFFKEAKISNVYQVEWHHGNHLYWPELDVDLSIDILKHPHPYPLIAH